MEIRWNSEAVTDGARNASEALQALLGCVARSESIREALDEAAPSEEGQTFRRLIEAYEACMRRLRAHAEGVEQLVAGMRAAIDIFEEAEASMLRRVHALESGDPQEAAGGRYIARSAEVTRPSAATSAEWLPEIVILPGSLNRNRIIPEWLDTILGQYPFNEA